MDNVSSFIRQFRWRFILMRLAVNALTLLIVVALVPTVYFVELSVLNVFFMAVVLGLFNALIRPVIQFLTLPLVFATYGLVIAFINGAILFLLAWFFPNRFAVTSLFWLIIAGLLMGVVGTFIESLFGMTRPILPEDMPQLRGQVDALDSHVVRRLLEERWTETRNAAMSDASLTSPVAEEEPVSAVSGPGATSQALAQPVVDQVTSGNPQLEEGDDAHLNV